MQIAEREVFELPLQLPDAEPVGQRRVDVGGELRQFAALLGRQVGRRAHARELPRQQDEHDAQVADDRQQQSAQAFGAARTAARGVQRPDFFGGLLAVDEVAHTRREACQLRRSQRDAALLQSVQNTGGQHPASPSRFSSSPSVAISSGSAWTNAWQASTRSRSATTGAKASTPCARTTRSSQDHRLIRYSAERFTRPF